MIEIVYKEEKKEARGNESFFQIPRNIRQIGEAKGNRRIYLEDYAYTFLRRQEDENRERGSAGILLGQHNWLDGAAYLFIRSAMVIGGMEVSPEHVSFTERIWEQVHETTEQYFKGQEILGWFLNLPEFSMEINEVILRAHLNHFGGNDKVLFLMEPTEKEEAFFTYDSGRLKRESGFYVYYEKNDAMQGYMIDGNANQSVEEPGPGKDRAVADFRRRVGEKQEERKKEQRGRHSAFYGLTVSVAAATLILALSYTEAGERIGAFFNRITGRESVTEPDPASVSAAGDSILAVTETPEPEKPSGETPAPGEEPIETPEPGTPSVTPAAETSSAPQASVREYTVKKGDTLSKICREHYGDLGRLDEICSLNQLDPDADLYPGQKIVLPQS